MIAFTGNHATQSELKKAYEGLGHTPPDPKRWEATLLITKTLKLRWACRKLLPEHTPVEEPHDNAVEDYDGQTRYLGWHVIAEAGELSWPPLRPESETWPALVKRFPTPSGEPHEGTARHLGKTVEEWHHDWLRETFLQDGGPAWERDRHEFQLDPALRDWNQTARDLVEFIDAHRPPKLTAEQRVMEQGADLHRLQAEAATAKLRLAHLMRNAAREQDPKPRRGFKSDLSRWGGVSRPTVDAWLHDADASVSEILEAGSPSTANN